MNGVDEDLAAHFEAWTAELGSQGTNPGAELAAWRFWVRGHPDRPAPPPGLLPCEVCGAYRPMADLLSGTVPAPAPVRSDPGVDRILVVCCVGCRPAATVPSLDQLRGLLDSLRRHPSVGQG